MTSPLVEAADVPSTLQPHEQRDAFAGSRVKSLRLKPITTVQSNIPCETAIEMMRDRGFDQLPVLAPSGKKLVGLVTLGNVLSRLTHGRATGKSPVSDVMFNFSKITEVVTDPRDMGLTSSTPEKANSSEPRIKDRKFVEITMDTPLSVLNRFFEWNSAAVVTERDEHGVMRPVAVATKVDLLTWMLHHKDESA